MKRFLSVFLSVATTLCCLSLPAAAAEGDLFPAVKTYEGFTDVAADSWFAPYVELCVETGLMNGVGGERFDPQGEVTCAQAVTLAARIHAARNGGDGSLPKAPEEWGTLKVEFENGTVLTFDSTQYKLHPVPMSSVLGASVSEEQMAQLDWFGLEDQVPAQVTAFLAETAGPYPATVYWNGERGAMRFRPDYEKATEAEQGAFRKMEGSLSLLRRPAAGDWLRDTVCWLEQVGLADQLSYFTRNADRAATRAEFIDCLNAVSEGLLTPINHITDYPDSSNQHPKDMVLAFYNAGILTGKDDYGTFDPEGTLTRAECAAMLSRLVRPELRLKFQPKEAEEKYSYTLTYLMDDPMSSHTVTCPVLPIITEDGKDNGILTLDGKLLPFPGDGTAPVSMYPNGYGTFFMSFWFTQDDGTKVEKGGVIDESGTFVVPPTAGCYCGWDLEDRRYITLSGNYEGTATLWDKDGKATELGVMSFDQVVEQYPNAGRMEQGPEVQAWGNLYTEENGHPVSEEFSWVGELTKDGRGFVGLDGKIYCIQFSER